MIDQKFILFLLSVFFSLLSFSGVVEGKGVGENKVTFKEIWKVISDIKVAMLMRAVESQKARKNVGLEINKF